jgi:DNA-binding MarR family transcriptional regulator
MPQHKHTRKGAAMTELVLETFRLNGRLLASGDRLVEPLGLSSARWQVLGAIHFAETPQPVAWLARSMGLSRQGVQRIANELEKEGLIAFQPNPHHRRASLVVLTDTGRKTYAVAEQRQTEWVNTISRDFDIDEIQCALNVMSAMRAILEDNSSSS